MNEHIDKMSRFVSSDLCTICTKPITRFESCRYFPKLLDVPEPHRHNMIIMRSEGMCDLDHRNNYTVYEQCAECNWLPVENKSNVLHNAYVEKVTAICFKCDGSIVHVGNRAGKLAYSPWHYTDGIPHRHDMQYNYAQLQCANGHADTHQIYSTCHCGWTQKRKS